jgi:transposase
MVAVVVSVLRASLGLCKCLEGATWSIARKSFSVRGSNSTFQAIETQLKELSELFFSTKSRQVESFFNRWYSWAICCRLAPMKDVARMLRAHPENLLTFTYLISNALTEVLTPRSKAWTGARGFRRFPNFRIRILFFCGRLNLYPSIH